MRVRYSATLNTGEVLCNTIISKDSVSILTDIWRDVRFKVSQLCANTGYSSNAVTIKYLIKDTKKLNRNERTTIAGPFTMCV